MQKIPDLWLNKGADRRLRGGHCWIYSNEIDSGRSPLGGFEAGDVVSVRASGGEALASAYMEPNSLICARVFSRSGARTLNAALVAEHLSKALALRQRFFEKPYYRLVYGDSDGLSGVIVDRFGEFLVLQLNTAGIERHQALLVTGLVNCLQPAGILLRADSRSRREQGLPEHVETVHGSVPELVPLVENGVDFRASASTGQKTGWFYDHRDSRARLRHYAPGKRVLDVYSYIGGWGVQAAAFGATQVCCVDSSAPALAQLVENARLNSVADKVDVQQGQATRIMEQLLAAGERYDLVVLDPPAFIQRKRDLGKGRKAYRRINELAMQLLEPGGILVSASCSMHLTMADLVEVMRGAAQRTQRQVQIVEFGHQGPDHPILPAIPETEYLKTVFAVVSPAG